MFFAFLQSCFSCGYQLSAITRLPGAAYVLLRAVRMHRPPGEGKRSGNSSQRKRRELGRQTDGRRPPALPRLRLVAVEPDAGREMSEQLFELRPVGRRQRRLVDGGDV